MLNNVLHHIFFTLTDNDKRKAEGIKGPFADSNPLERFALGEKKFLHYAASSNSGQKNGLPLRWIMRSTNRVSS